MWTFVCHVPSMLPEHSKKNGSSGLIAASGLSQHLVKKLLLLKVAEKQQSWVKRAGSALLMEVKALLLNQQI